ncbi:MAG: ATP-dependent Clp protease adaptor ClpS [Chloroflexi bacterium]|nr:ATP-dependent Clp protease adaptor ClpS [Chloroflexota bacterium]
MPSSVSTLTNIWFRVPTHTGNGLTSVIRIDEEPFCRGQNYLRNVYCCKRLFSLAVGVKRVRFVVGRSIDQPSASAERETSERTTPAEVYETSSGRSDRWAVVLLDDDHHSMDYVIWALLKTIPDMSTAEASLVMLEAHNTGKGVVTLCGRDQAMSYRNALRILQLGCEVEPGW